MKNELDMKFKEFLDEMNSKKEIFNEITSTKDTITEYQRLNDINQKNLEKKFQSWNINSASETMRLSAPSRRR